MTKVMLRDTAKGTTTILKAEEAKYYTATQFRLMWWKFKRHKLAMLGIITLAVFGLFAVFAEIIAPYTAYTRNPSYLDGPPHKFRFFSEEGFHFPPYVYGVKTERNPKTLAMEFVVDTSIRYPIRFFINGEPYKLWGLIPASVHLFGLDNGFIYLIGADHMGRDLFSRVVYGTRISLSIGLVGVAITFVLGLLIGGVSGFFGGRVDMIIQRGIEIVKSIPTLPLWMALAAVLPTEWSPLRVYFAITVILGFLGWPDLARRVRSLLLSLRQEDFVIAAKIAGSSDFRIITRHLLPAAMSYIIVQLTIAFPYMILGETALSFIGLGLRPPVVSWGVLLQSAQKVLALAVYPWRLTPVVFVILAVLAFSFVGDGMRDAADPYAR